MEHAPLAPGRDEAAVVLDGAFKTYPGPRHVEALKPCQLRVERGDYLAIMGPSGSGKSTLLNILGLLDALTGGSYALAGNDVSSLRERERNLLRAQEVGFVFQFFHLLPSYTAVENVMLGLLYGSGVARRNRRAIAERQLRRVGLEHRADAYSSTLSGGECQRVAIARALVHEPGILLCDEPTGNLDSETSRSILELIDDLHDDGLTVIMVTHDQQIARLATRIVTIYDGVVSESMPLPHEGTGDPA